eukprot:2503995-Amphidinium_carterae.1
MHYAMLDSNGIPMQGLCSSMLFSRGTLKDTAVVLKFPLVVFRKDFENQAFALWAVTYLLIIQTSTISYKSEFSEKTQILNSATPKTKGFHTYGPNGTACQLGAKAIILYAGKDCTEEFDMLHERK